MPTIVLPPANRPRRLLSFWLVASALIAVFISAFFSWSLGAVLAPALFLPVWFKPELASIPYRGWNKIARIFGAAARFLALGIIFYVILIAVGRTGALLKLRLPAPGESLWSPRRSIDRGAFHVQHGVPTEGFSIINWAGAFLSWTVKSGNLWAAFLLPFLFLVHALDTEEEENYPAGIYTLF